jgi:hypothetical protein
MIEVKEDISISNQSDMIEVKEDINISEKLNEIYQDFIRPVVEAFIRNDKDKIVNLIYYPLERQYPIPSINNKHEMVERFTQVFDENITNMIKDSSIANSWYDDNWYWCGITSDIGSISIGYYSYDHGGAIYGKIFRITCQSLQEKEMRNNIINEMKNNLHESLKDFDEPVLLCETDNYIIRIDWLHDYDYNCRLAVWNKGKKQNESPDIVLTNGERIPDGSGGNHYFLFVRDNIQYIIYVDVMNDITGISYGEFIIYNGMEMYWYDRGNEKNISVYEKITKIER